MTRAIYLATTGEWSDFSVVAAFTREKDARDYELADNVQEIELNDGPIEVRDWHQIVWWPGAGERTSFPLDSFPNPSEGSFRRVFTGPARHAEHGWETEKRSPEGVRLVVGGWELERVRKVFSEQRAKYIATADLRAAVQPDPGSST